MGNSSSSTMGNSSSSTNNTRKHRGSETTALSDCSSPSKLPPSFCFDSYSQSVLNDAVMDFPADDVDVPFEISMISPEKALREQAELSYVTTKSAEEYWQYEKNRSQRNFSEGDSAKMQIGIAYVDNETALRAWHDAKLEHGCTGITAPAKQMAMAHAA